MDVRTASKANSAENILDEKRLRTAFHDGSNAVPKALLEASSLPIQPSSSTTALSEQLSPSIVPEPSPSSSNIMTVTNSALTKTINGDREKRISRTFGSPDDNVR